MTWREIQQENIRKALDSQEVIRQEYKKNLVYATLFFKTPLPKRGVLIVHGMTGNRLSLNVLAKRLAQYGYFCMCIDLPSHYENPTPFSMGSMAETISEAVTVLKTEFQIPHVAIIGHSIGTEGALFSTAGYNRTVENNLFSLWNTIVEALNKESEEQDITRRSIEEHKKAEVAFFQMKQLLYAAAKSKINNSNQVSTLVLLSPPKVVKSAFTGASILKRINPKIVKKLIDRIIHQKAIRQVMKEGNLAEYTPENDPFTMYMQFFKTSQIPEFFEYVSQMNEPADFIKLLELLTKLTNTDATTNFFKYYLQKYLKATPKLFIYGKNDAILKGFLPFVNRESYEKYYESCGNAKILFLDTSHVMTNDPKQTDAGISVTNDEITTKIVKFIDSTM